MNNPAPKDRRRSRFTDKVQKGFTAAYPTQSSIPFKSQYSIIPESEKKGFNSQARRFYHKKDDVPGPGFYNVTHRSPVSNSVSLSKKGTGTFPSMSARLDPIISKFPAANAYTLPSEFTSRKDFSDSCSSMFQLPSFMKIPKCETPAPNHYNSKTVRGLKLASTGPGPGYYNPNAHTKVPKKSLFPRNPILNFSAPPLPLPPQPPLPGPGQYEIVDYAGPPKYFISSASFVSNTSRWTVAPAQAGLPGPATYRPEVPGKQSFLYNEDNKWIPAL